MAQRERSITSPSTTGVVIIVVTALVVVIQLYVSIPLAGTVGSELGTNSVTEALASGFSLCYAIGFLIFGPLSDHFGRRPVLVGGLVALALTTLAVGLAPSLAVLGVLRALQGAAAATFSPSALAYFGETLPRHRRAGAVGAISVAFLTAGILGQVAAAEVAALWGWRWMFYLSAILVAILAIAVFYVMGRSAGGTDERPLLRRYLHLAQFAVRPSSLVLALGYLMLYFGFVGLYTLLGPHLGSLGVTGAQVSWVRAAALPAMFVSLLAGPISRRFGLPTTAAMSYGVAAVGSALVIVSQQHVVALTLATIVFVAGVALSVPTLILIWGEAAAPHRGIGMAINGFVLFLGASIGPYAPKLGTGFTAPMVYLAIGYVISGAIVYGASRYIERHLERT